MSAEICSVGDAMLGENLYHFRRGIVTRFRGRYSDLIVRNVRDLLFRDVCAIFLNLECSLVPEDWDDAVPERSVYRAPESALDLVGETNAIVIANVANNHFSQHGTESVAFSLGALEKRRIQVVGRDRNPIGVALAGRVCRVWGVSLVPDAHYCGAYFSSTAGCLIAELGLPPKPVDEYWVICIHWGEEYLPGASDEQRGLAQALSRAGFDLILGHHPHVVQPVARVASTLVLYSQGNFIFDQNFSRPTQQGLAARVTLDDNRVQLFLTRQRDYRVVSALPVSEESVARPTLLFPSRLRPLAMRFLMKVELGLHLRSVDRAVMRSLARRIGARFGLMAR